MNKFDDLYFKKAAWLCEASEDDDDEDKVDTDETETDDTAEDADVEAVEEIECPDCDGTGEDEDGEECETCGGTGVIAPEESEEDIVADAEDAVADAEGDDDTEADPDAEPDPDEEYELDLADPVCPCCGAHLNVISDTETDAEETAAEEDVPTTEVDGFEVADPSIMGPETNIYYSDEDAEPVEYSEDDGEDDDNDVDESTQVNECGAGCYGGKKKDKKKDKKKKKDIDEVYDIVNELQLKTLIDESEADVTFIYDESVDNIVDSEVYSDLCEALDTLEEIDYEVDEQDPSCLAVWEKKLTEAAGRIPQLKFMNKYDDEPARNVKYICEWLIGDGANVIVDKSSYNHSYNDMTSIEMSVNDNDVYLEAYDFNSFFVKINNAITKKFSDNSEPKDVEEYILANV